MEDDDLFNDSDEEPTTSAGKKPVAGTVGWEYGRKRL